MKTKSKSKFTEFMDSVITNLHKFLGTKLGLGVVFIMLYIVLSNPNRINKAKTKAIIPFNTEISALNEKIDSLEKDNYILSTELSIMKAHNNTIIEQLGVYNKSMARQMSNSNAINNSILKEIKNLKQSEDVTVITE